MKVAPILHELRLRGVPHLFVHTGQHYDVQMSETLLNDLGAPQPDVLLEVGSATHAVQTARTMERFEPVLLEHRPSWVVVVGDVNSTLACALVTAKLRDELECKIAHVEAGLRSNNWSMPEEINRVLTDRLSDLLLTPSEDALANIALEGLNTARVTFVGNVMIDSLFHVLPKARMLGAPERYGVIPGSYVLATLHRPSNVDRPGQLKTLLTALATISDEWPVLFPMHPRTKAKAESFALGSLLDRLIVTAPLGYTEMVALMDGAVAVVTDSGGVQEETTVLGVPCVTVREQTERPVTITHGTNRLVTWPPTVAGVLGDLQKAVVRGRIPTGASSPPGWDGYAAARIVDALLARALTPTRQSGEASFSAQIAAS
ncbi:MAG: UDP-N-acetylglucosamine 2-epimerase [Gemmatimonadales bacterium]|nr:UDP-N-acetylglucosamine 2-epimerase [Gemmatimonadales bacterium]